MATHSIEVSQPNVVDQVLLIPIADIAQGERLRPVDPVWAAALGQVMQQEGQQTAIEVCRLPSQGGYTLVVGGHRLEGARLTGQAYIRAIVVSNDRDIRRMREVSENVWRQGLGPVDRAAFIAEAVAIHKRRAGVDPTADGRVVGAAARWQNAVKNEAADATVTMTVAYGFTDAVASELGLSASVIERDLMLHRRLAPSLVARLRAARHPVLSNATQLRALAKLDEAAQAQVVKLLTDESASLNYGQPKTVAEAISHPQGPKPAGEKPAANDKRMSAFIGAFSRMGLAEKKGALTQLAGLLPAGFRIVEGPEPRAKAAFPAKHVEYREAALAALDDARALLDGLEEDEIVTGERATELSAVAAELQLTRFTVAGNGFELIDDQQRRAIVDAAVEALGVIDGPIADRLRAAVGAL